MINSERTPAAENPWYVLATLAGEQTKGHDVDFHSKNIAYWNAWASQGMTKEEKAAIKSADGLSIFDDSPEWDYVEADVVKRFNERLPNAVLPDPSQIVNFSNVDFPNHVHFWCFFFPATALFINTTFSGYADFRSAAFSGDADFSSAEFSGPAHFHNAAFSGPTHFHNAAFYGDAHFSSAAFSEYADFSSAAFSGKANFFKAAFSGKANFHSAAFSEYADFDSAVFFKDAGFKSAAFSGDADFSSAEFSGDAHFNNVAFCGPSKFIKTKFQKKADFKDAVFDAPCNLRDAKFETAYPDLEGTLLHSKTNVTAEDEHWLPAKIKRRDKKALNICAHLRQNMSAQGLVTAEDEHWPPAKIKQALNSCAHLRQSMSAQGLNEAAHFFFRREMDYRAKLSKCWERPFYAIYRLGEYGYGVWQPLAGILALWLVGALPLICWGSLHWATAFGLSFANIFKFFGFQRVYFEGDVIDKLNCFLKIMTGAQTIAGYFLLFLLGLGLRNRFRLK